MLSEALVGAYETNPSLQIARASLAATDESVASALSNLRPQVEIGGSATSSENYTTNTDTESWTLGVTVDQTIYAGGQNLLGFEAARLSVFSDRQELLDTEQDILFAAVQAFMDVRRDAEIVRLSQNNVRVLNEQLNAANDRFEVGDITRTDVSQTEARRAAARSNLVAAQGNLRVSQETYRAVIGEYPTAPLQPTNLPRLPANADAAEQIAINTHPRVLAAQFDLSAAEVSLSSAQRAKRPSITGSIAAQRADSGSTLTTNPTNSASISVQGSVPLYKGDALNSDIRAAVANLNASKFNLQNASLITRQGVRSAFANWQAAVAGITSSDEQVRASRIAFDGVSEEASVGARTTLDVLDAEQELRDAESASITARRDEVVARFSVLSEMGLLTAEKLGLDVALFNPEENFNAVATGSSALGARREQLLDRILKRSGN
ncbi:MAG: TolC family outer membrane protein [Pseudomonadota bacterium]